MKKRIKEIIEDNEAEITIGLLCGTGLGLLTIIAIDTFVIAKKIYE